MNNNDNAAGPPVGADGAGTRSRQNLSERVRSLRLGETPTKAGGSRGGFLPWALCILFALAAVAFGAKAFWSPAASTESGTAVHSKFQDHHPGRRPRRT